MTDLAARLRDVLSDELLARADDPSWNPELSEADSFEVQREVLIQALLPLLSSLLEEREREIAAIEPLHDVGIHPLGYECAFCHEQGDEGVFNMKPEDFHRSDCLWLRARLASSSSPAAPQEQK